MPRVPAYTVAEQTSTGMNLQHCTSVASLLALAIACKGKPPPVVAHDPKAQGASGSLATLDGFEGEIALSSKGTLWS